MCTTLYEANLDELATKSDLREVETGLCHKNCDLFKDMDAKFEKLDAALGVLTLIFKFLQP